MRKILLSIAVTMLFALNCLGQSEVLTNTSIAEMSKVGLEKQIIIKKINETPNAFDVSTNALIELKKAGVEAEVITLMMERAGKKEAAFSENQNATEDKSPKNYSENTPPVNLLLSDNTIPTPKEALLRAKSVAIVKSSLHPARQALEKELMKRREWQKYDLALVRYKEEADIYIEIGYVSMSWITHRYVFRIYDRRSGVVITAGETTSWGNLAGNLAREITQKMEKIGAK